MKIFFTLSIITLLIACLADNIVRKPSGLIHQEQNKKIYDEVINHVKTGDWLVIRGYHSTDNLVAGATGIPISHVGVIDADSMMVIEAEGIGVHATPLAEFIDKSDRVLVIRPRWFNDINGEKAIKEAYKLVGKDYDFLGTIGFNFGNKFYCSELAIDIYKEWHDPQLEFPTVIKPGELYLYGKILYDSLPRLEMQTILKDKNIE